MRGDEGREERGKIRAHSSPVNEEKGNSNDSGADRGVERTAALVEQPEGLQTRSSMSRGWSKVVTLNTNLSALPPQVKSLQPRPLWLKLGLLSRPSLS